MSIKKEYSKGLLKRTCCVCGNYWPHSGACPRCKEELAQKEYGKKEKNSK